MRETAKFTPADFKLAQEVASPFWNSLNYKHPSAKFKHMRCIGKIKSFKPFPTEGPNYTVNYSDTFENWDPEHKSNIFKAADHHAVRPTKESMDISINKMDVPCVCPDPELDDTMKKAILYTIKYLTYAKQKIDPKKELKFNGAASPGLPYKGSKADALESDLFRELFPDLDHVPVDEMNAKHEELSMEDHLRKKCRTVFCAPLDFVAKEKVLFEEQNTKIKEGHDFSWIKYGMVKQYGGFDKLWKKIQRFSLRFESDCSGWDRIVFLLYVYYVRKALTENWKDFENLWNYVEFFNTHPVVLLPDGTIYIRETGNDSGKNNTTVDNSIAHLIIAFYFFIERLKELGKEVSLENILRHAELAIYSDDKTGSCDHEFWEFDVESFKEFERKIYAKFGLTIKPSQQLVTLGEAGSLMDPRHSFLGSYAYYREDYGMYVPFPRVGKVCSSLINKLPKLRPDLIFKRFLVLTTLLYPDNTLFQDAISITKKYMDENPEHNAEFQCILEDQNLTLDSEVEFTRLYLGFECLGSPRLFFCGGSNSITNESWKFENSNVDDNSENNENKTQKIREREGDQANRKADHQQKTTPGTYEGLRQEEPSKSGDLDCPMRRKLRQSIMRSMGLFPRSLPSGRPFSPSQQ